MCTVSGFSVELTPDKVDTHLRAADNCVDMQLSHKAQRARCSHFVHRPLAAEQLYSLISQVGGQAIKGCLRKY